MKLTIKGSTGRSRSSEYIKSAMFDYLAESMHTIDGEDLELVFNRVYNLDTSHDVDEVLELSADEGVTFVEALRMIEDEDITSSISVKGSCSNINANTSTVVEDVVKYVYDEYSDDFEFDDLVGIIIDDLEDEDGFKLKEGFNFTREDIENELSRYYAQ